MRLRILSDLHLEFGPFEAPAVDADAVILAGDIHTGQNAFPWIRASFPDTPVIYILGNHEFYGQKIPKLTEEMTHKAQGTHIHVLENKRFEEGDVVFLGATLWTDFQLDGNSVLAEAAAVTNVTDFRRIRVSPSYRRFRPADARKLHAGSLKWLADQTAKLRGRKVVVITHHAPSPQSVPARYRNSPLNPAFASNLDHIVKSSGAAVWIHGHIHEASDYCIGSTRIIANPRGYPAEQLRAFNPTLTIEV